MKRVGQEIGSRRLLRGSTLALSLVTAAGIQACSLDRLPHLGMDADAAAGEMGTGGSLTGGSVTGGVDATGGVASTGGALATGGLSSGGAEATGGTTVFSGACDMEGTWALRAVVDVAWGGRTSGLAKLTDDGRGKIEVLARVDLDAVGADGKLVGKARVCGVQLPPFYATVGGFLCESYVPVFDPAIWDSPDMPLPDIAGQLECPTVDDCRASYAAAQGLFGIDLADPAAFPAATDSNDYTCPNGNGVDCFPDQDLDGRPGIAVSLVNGGMAPQSSPLCRNGYELRNAPLSDNPNAIVDAVRRADRLDLGISAELQPDLVFSDCDHGEGGGRADGFDSRAIGCQIEPGTVESVGWFLAPITQPAGPNEDCLERERLFMDENLPVYAVLNEGDPPAPVLEVADQSPSAGPRFQVVRITDPLEGCASVLDVEFD